MGVNGESVARFDEFIERFVAAQEHGFPIDFSVLRHEQSEENDGAEDALEGFFNATNFMDLAGQLQRKFANIHIPMEVPSTSGGACPVDPDDMPLESITENPYIQALRNRRVELCRNVEGWTTEVVESLASRLATQRSDALASLTKT